MAAEQLPEVPEAAQQEIEESSAAGGHPSAAPVTGQSIACEGGRQAPQATLRSQEETEESSSGGGQLPAAPITSQPAALSRGREAPEAAQQNQEETEESSPGGGWPPAAPITSQPTAASTASAADCSVGFRLSDTPTAVSAAAAVNSVRSVWSPWRWPSEQGKLPSYVQRAFRLKAFVLVFCQLSCCLAASIAVRELGGYQLLEDTCSFEARPNSFAVGRADSDSGLYDLEGAKMRCIVLKAKCGSVTCKTSKSDCSVRVSSDPVENIFEETTYVKSCKSLVPVEYFWVSCGVSVICIMLLYCYAHAFPVNYLMLAVNTVSTSLTWSFGGVAGVLFADTKDLHLQVLGTSLVAIFVTAVVSHILSLRRVASEVIVPVSFVVGWATGVVANTLFMHVQDTLEGSMPWLAIGITFLLYGILLIDVGGKLVTGNPDNFMRIVVAMDSALLVIASIPFLILSFCLVRSFRVTEGSENRRPAEAHV